VKLESVCCVGGEAAPVDRADELFVRRVNLTVVQQAVQLLRRVTADLKFKDFFCYWFAPFGVLYYFYFNVIASFIAYIHPVYGRIPTHDLLIMSQVP
jgi:hypothetical protein